MYKYKPLFFCTFILLPYGVVAVASKKQLYNSFEVKPHTPTVFYAFVQKHVNFSNNKMRGREMGTWKLWNFNSKETCYDIYIL